MTDNYHSIVRNPILSAFVFGPGAATLTAIGTAILGDKDRNILDDTMTVLIGGVTVGAMVSGVALCLPNNATENNHLNLKLCLGALAVTAMLTAPLMGKEVMQLDTQYTSILLEEAVGAAAIAGATATVGVCILAAAGCVSLGLELSKCCHTMFNKITQSSSEETSALLRNAAPACDKV